MDFSENGRNPRQMLACPGELCYIVGTGVLMLLPNYEASNTFCGAQLCLLGQFTFQGENAGNGIWVLADAGFCQVWRSIPAGKMPPGIAACEQ